MDTKEIIAALNRDYLLINEAFRRLIDGTCCLSDDERPYIEELLNKVQNAIYEHISLEEDLFFSYMSADEAELMRQEHIKLKNLLTETHFSIVTQRSLTFKVLLKELGSVLEEHTEIESHVLRAFQLKSVDPEKITSIQKRIDNNLV